MENTAISWHCYMMQLVTVTSTLLRYWYNGASTILQTNNEFTPLGWVQEQFKDNTTEFEEDTGKKRKHVLSMPRHKDLPNKLQLLWTCAEYT